MKNVTILFKSGASISFKANEFDGTKNGFGQLITLNWDCKGLNKYPARINIDNVDAIMVEEVEVDEKR